MSSNIKTVSIDDVKWCFNNEGNLVIRDLITGEETRVDTSVVSDVNSMLKKVELLERQKETLLEAFRQMSQDINLDDYVSDLITQALNECQRLEDESI